MNIENILIEHFPRLKCANFSILFNKSFEDVSSIRIHLRPTEIFVNFENNRCKTIELSTLSVQIQINSLSLLIAKGNLISFRINIASDFDEELLKTNVTCEQRRPLKRLSMNINPNEEFQIICDNCSGPLSDTLQYRRILELPSENMDSNEWFCHKPNQAHCNHSTKNPMIRDRNKHDDTEESDPFSINRLMPNENDLLFGHFFGLFKRNNFTNIQINSQQKMVHCRRCLNHIGELLSNDLIKIWNGNVKVNRLREQILQHIFNDSDSLFGNVLVIFDRISYDYELLGYQTIKLLFEAYNLKGTQTYLFIQTMSRNLELYQMSIDSIANDDDEAKVSMARVDGIKCLFLCEENTEPTILEFWQKDVNVVSVQISIEMLNCAAEQLQHLAQYVPEPFRMNNGFCLSYLSNNIK